MEDWKGCIRCKSGLFGVAFVRRFVKGRELWEVIIAVGRHLGRMVVAFDFVVVGCLVSFVGRSF